MTDLSPVYQVIFAAAASVESFVLYSKLPFEVKKYVDACLAAMAADQHASTEFERALIETNPAPDRVTNHYKWRGTQLVRIRLKIPRFQLEMHLVRAAYIGRNLDNVDLSGMVYHLRAVSNDSSLINLVGTIGIEGLATIIRQTFPRVSSADLSIRNITDRYRRYTYSPIHILLLDKP